MGSDNLVEAGKVLSNINKTQLIAAWRAFKAVFVNSGIDPDGETDEKETDEKESLSLSEASLSATNTSERIQAALKAMMYPHLSYIYVRDLFPTYAIYQPGYEGNLYAVKYTINEKGVIALGSQQRVVSRSVYETLEGEPVEPEVSSTAESDPLIDLTSDLTPLIEAVSDDPLGEIPVKIIAPGKGSSGYYPSEVLRRDGPGVFVSGLQMFWDHPSATEARERPEGSMGKLAGVLTEGAKWQEAGPKGPGLYAKAKIFADYAEAVKSKAAHTGLSIRAKGHTRAKEVPGIGTVPVVESIISATSVDFVTRPAAGGAVILQESGEGSTAMSTTSELTERMKAQELEIARLREANAMRSAREFVDKALRSVSLPDVTKNRIAPALVQAYTLTEAGDLDTVALNTLIETRVQEEAQYLAGLGVGAVRGMGGSNSSSEADPAKLNEAIAQSLKRLSKLA